VFYSLCEHNFSKFLRRAYANGFNFFFGRTFRLAEYKKKFTYFFFYTDDASVIESCCFDCFKKGYYWCLCGSIYLFIYSIIFVCIDAI